MCFKIDYGGVAWDQRYVYKKLDRVEGEDWYVYKKRKAWYLGPREPDYGSSWISYWKRFVYELGATYEIEKDAKTKIFSEASSGFYVYKDLKVAATSGDGSRVLCLEVKKEDFLYENETGTIATYRKVRVVGEIPLTYWRR